MILIILCCHCFFSYFFQKKGAKRFVWVVCTSSRGPKWTFWHCSSGVVTDVNQHISTKDDKKTEKKKLFHFKQPLWTLEYMYISESTRCTWMHHKAVLVCVKLGHRQRAEHRSRAPVTTPKCDRNFYFMTAVVQFHNICKAAAANLI